MLFNCNFKYGFEDLTHKSWSQIRAVRNDNLSRDRNKTHLKCFKMKRCDSRRCKASGETSAST